MKQHVGVDAWLALPPKCPGMTSICEHGNSGPHETRPLHEMHCFIHPIQRSTHALCLTLPVRGASCSRLPVGLMKTLLCAGLDKPSTTIRRPSPDWLITSTPPPLSVLPLSLDPFFHLSLITLHSSWEVAGLCPNVRGLVAGDTAQYVGHFQQLTDTCI